MYFVSLMSMIYSFASKIKQNLCDFSSVHYTLILPAAALPFCVSHFLFLTEANQFGYLSQQKYCQRIMLQKKRKNAKKTDVKKWESNSTNGKHAKKEFARSEWFTQRLIRARYIQAKPPEWHYVLTTWNALSHDLLEQFMRLVHAMIDSN